MKQSIDVILVLAPLILILIGLTVTVIIDPYISRKQRRVMVVIIILCLSLIVQNVIEDHLAGGSLRWLLRTMDAIYGYSIRPVILICFLYIVHPTGKYWPWWLLAGANAVINATSLFSHICFWINENNHYHRGPLSYTCLIISMILLANLFIQTMRNKQAGGKWDRCLPIIVVVSIIVSVIMDDKVGTVKQTVSFLTIAVVVSSLFYYIWLHLQFVRSHEHALQAEQRIQIMMTQIQPHFLFNTIATIKALCSRDSKMAAEMADKFGRYLRQNLDTLDTTGLIPFQKELEHTRLYADIEMVRFDNVRVEYFIQDAAFSVPPLVLQPMVENAIRHGVRIREHGIVRVTTRRGENAHEIIIQDNGVGFDVKATEADEDRHIGIYNVRERVEKMCGGTFDIKSIAGSGTTVTIRLPLKQGGTDSESNMCG